MLGTRGLIADLNERLQLTSAISAPDYYASHGVRWIAHIASDAKKPSVKWERRGDDKDIPEMTVPSVSRGVAVIPYLLCDTAEYVLGFSDPDRAERVRRYKAEFDRQLIGAAAIHESVGLVARVLPTIKPPEGMKPSDRIAFAVDDVILTDLVEVQKHWAKLQSNRVADGGTAECSCCGTVGGIMRVIPDWIIGVPGSKNNRCALVSANENALWHYERPQATAASLCYSCSSGAVRSINQLLETSSFSIGGVAVLWWCTSEVPFPLDEALLSPSEDLLYCTRLCGRPEHDRFHLLLLSAHDSRAVIRHYGTYPAAEVGRHLAVWMQISHCVPLIDRWELDPDGGVNQAGKPKKRYRPGLLNRLHAGGDASRVAQPTVAAFVLSAVTGKRLPLSAASMSPRTFFESVEAPAEAAIISLARAYAFDPQSPQQEEVTVNGTTRMAESPAYRCGELLATLERIQRAAIPGINRTVGDRCLRAASVTPAPILSGCLLDAKAHLAKLTRNGERSSSYSDELNEAIRGLDIPVRLDAASQAAFCLGYYDRSTSRQNGSARKDSGEEANKVAS